MTTLTGSHPLHLARAPLLPELATGQAAGLIMAAAMMLVYTVFLGHSPFYPLQVIGSVFLGEEALEGINVIAVVTGLVLHQLGPTLLWSLVFAMLHRTLKLETPMECLYLGLAVGFVAMIGPYALMPMLFEYMHGVDIWNREVPMGWDWAAHMIFGASFMLYPTIKKELE